MINILPPDLRCNICKNSEVIIDTLTGSYVCKNCGTVIEKKSIDFGREWRIFFEDKNQKARTGAPITFALHDKGVGSEIAENSFNTLQKRTKILTSEERRLYTSFEILDRISSQYNIPKEVIETCAILYRKVTKNSLIKGKSIKGTLGVTLYFAYKIHDFPITIKEITDMLKIDKKEISKCYSLVLEIIKNEKDLISKIKLNNPKIYIEKIAKALNLDYKIETLAIKILDAAMKTGIASGKSPKSLASAAVYLACIMTNNKKTQKEIANYTQISEVTLRNRCKELIKRLDVEIIL
ncbi:MAG: TFIIB-type zinc ribbon-containing protein [Thermoproteota archaeon]|nr:TFIIB-type zinc ribbon-containing protein [Thermoproteota archaeon]